MHTVKLKHNFLIKSCPFCGNIPSLIKTFTHEGNGISVECEKCKITMVEVCGNSSNDAISEIVINKWNFRQ